MLIGYDQFPTEFVLLCIFNLHCIRTDVVTIMYAQLYLATLIWLVILQDVLVRA